MVLLLVMISFIELDHFAMQSSFPSLNLGLFESPDCWLVFRLDRIVLSCVSAMFSCYFLVNNFVDFFFFFFSPKQKVVFFLWMIALHL